MKSYDCKVEYLAGKNNVYTDLWRSPKPPMEQSLDQDEWTYEIAVINANEFELLNFPSFNPEENSDKRNHKYQI